MMSRTARALQQGGSGSSSSRGVGRTITSMRPLATQAECSHSSALPRPASASTSNRVCREYPRCFKRRHSTVSAALHPTPANSAAAETASTDAGSSVSYDYELFGTLGKPRRRTQLPTPLPPAVTGRRTDILKRLRQERDTTPGSRSIQAPSSLEDLTSTSLQALNENDTFFTSSETVESIAILRACLSTGLTLRAINVFAGMREQSSLRRSVTVEHQPPAEASAGGSASASTQGFNNLLDVKIYNAMIGTYFREAWHESSSVKRTQWLTKAWLLFQDMDRSKNAHHGSWVDPAPDAGTYAVMAKGVVRLKRSNKYPARMQDLTNILSSLRHSGIRVYDVVTSSVFTQEQGELDFVGGMQPSKEGEPDARGVVQSLCVSATEMGDLVLSTELEQVSRLLQDSEKVAIDETARSDGALQATGPVPELLPVTSYTQGIEADGGVEESEISFNLRVLRENLSIVSEARQSSADPYERQYWLEFGAIDAARKRFEEGVNKLEKIGLSGTPTLQRKGLQKWMWTWYKKLEQSLKADLQRLNAAPKDSHYQNTLEAQTVPFLQLLTPEKLAMITVLEMMRLQATSGVSDGMKTASALVSIGKAVEREHYSHVLAKNADWLKRRKNMDAQLRQNGLTDRTLRREMRRLLVEESPEAANVSEWSNNIRARVGSYLVEHLMNSARVKRSAIDRDGVAWEDDQPAFYSSYQYIRGLRLGVIRLNEAVAERLAHDSSTDTLHPRHLPMLVPPNAWIKHDSGGYLSVRTVALRYKDDFEQASYLKAASEDGSLEYVLTGLDVLGSTAWRINKEIFDVMLTVWNSGKGLAEMPPVQLDAKEPERPENYETDVKARGEYLQKMKAHNLAKMSNHSRRCEVSYRLEIARAFLGERIYFPHNMDFRGRAYPMPPHLNHIGNDISRGLLLFDTAKPLGPVGLRWLRIHLANVYGFDKASFKEREQFALDHEKDIMDSVADPLGGSGWWLKADDPWQCLATCMELKKAYEHPEGPEKFMSHLPVHQDGTCNGLQHYAALGGDLAGAEQVNLVGTDRPSDVYTAVSDLVVASVDKDAQEGLLEAQLLEGKIGRKVVKQTVMTTVYGVTFIGAKAQVAKQLVDRGLESEHVWKCSAYLAKKIMASIGDLFSGAEAIQNWLTESALLVAKSIPPERLEEVNKLARTGRMANQYAKEQMTSVIWTTPLGLPVVQPYRKVLRKQVATSMQTVYIHDPHLATQVSPGKQASAFPPNFIHSLDATHMFLTALECQSAGLTFASVHDSYWTHACDIETMSDIIRDTFVRLHSCDILAKLKEEFLERYKGYKVPVTVAKKALAKRAKRLTGKSISLQETSGSLIVEETESGKLKPQRTKITFAEGVAESLGEIPDVSGVGAVESSDHISSEEGGASNVVATGLESWEQQQQQQLQEPQSKGKGKKRPAMGKDAKGETNEKVIALGDILPEIPERGSFDVNEIKRSLYFFS